MRQIKAKDIKPGMTIRWGYGDVSYQCPLAGVECFNNDQDVQGETPQGKTVLIGGDDDVLVVKEPAQPEEPTEFGIMVIVDGCPAVRINTRSSETGIWALEPVGQGPLLMPWAALLEMGDVVVPDQGWTAPEAPKVPKRIEEWPGNDTALRAHGWMDRLGSVWRYEHTGTTTGWVCPGVSPQYQPWGSPFTRVTDA